MLKASSSVKAYNPNVWASKRQQMIANAKKKREEEAILKQQQQQQNGGEFVNDLRNETEILNMNSKWEDCEPTLLDIDNVIRPVPPPPMNILTKMEKREIARKTQMIERKAFPPTTSKTPTQSGKNNTDQLVTGNHPIPTGGNINLGNLVKKGKLLKLNGKEGFDDGGKNTRQMLDKNTLRLRGRRTFLDNIKIFKFDNKILDLPVVLGLENVVASRSSMNNNVGTLTNNPDVFTPDRDMLTELSSNQDLNDKVCIRVRPLFRVELEKKMEYNVVSVSNDFKSIFLHNCLYKSDLKTPLINNVKYSNFTKCLPSCTTDRDMYDLCAQSSIGYALRQDDSLVNIFMFGQTGSGKTYTMNQIQKLSADQIFEYIDNVLHRANPDQTFQNAQGGSSRGLCAEIHINRKQEMTMSISSNTSSDRMCDDEREEEENGSGCSSEVSLESFEICGKKVFDLLGKKKEECRIRDTGDGCLHVEGTTELRAVKSAVELLKHFDDAQSRRTTESTGANDTSSRSHMISIVRIYKKYPMEDPSVSRILLVDLAGSERKKDSMYHSSDRQREGAEINASLYALKECMKWRSYVYGNGNSSSIAVPFRQSLLTKILSESFKRQDSKITVIGTVSPCATDTEHTMSTLDTLYEFNNNGQKTTQVQNIDGDKAPPAGPLKGKAEKVGGYPQGQNDVKNWGHEEVKAWINKIGFGWVNLSSGTTGRFLLRFSRGRCVQICNNNENLGNKFFDLIHDLNVASKPAVKHAQKRDLEEQNLTLALQAQSNAAKLAREKYNGNLLD